MVLVKQVNDRFCENIEKETNDILKELERKGGKFIDIKYTCNPYMHEMSAIIIYEI